MARIDRKPYGLGGQAIHQNIQRAQYCFPEGQRFSDRQIWGRAARATGRRQVLKCVRPNKIVRQTLSWSILNDLCGGNVVSE
jgi:hypothetical protein